MYFNRKNLWIRFWLRYAGTRPFGRFAYRLAAMGTPPYYGRFFLSHLNARGYISYKAKLHHPLLKLGNHIFIGDNILIYQDNAGGPVILEDNVKLIGNTTIQTGEGGSCSIGKETTIQPNCQFSAYKSAIQIGARVAVAPNCAFYPYNHGIAPEQRIYDQPLQSKGDIIIEDDVWLSVGTIILDGVHIGQGAVIGAGSVVAKDVPSGAVAVGTPARVIKMRDDISIH